MSYDIERAMDSVRRRWKSTVVLALAESGLRFGELRSGLPDVRHKVLIDVLRDLERDGIVARHVIASGRRHVRYELTERGQALVPVLSLLANWFAHGEGR